MILWNFSYTYFPFIAFSEESIQFSGQFLESGFFLLFSLESSSYILDKSSLSEM
jgi:hypothetical protein